MGLEVQIITGTITKTRQPDGTYKTTNCSWIADTCDPASNNDRENTGIPLRPDSEPTYNGGQSLDDFMDDCCKAADKKLKEASA